MEGQSKYVKNETYRIYSTRWIRKELVSEYLLLHTRKQSKLTSDSTTRPKTVV